MNDYNDAYITPEQAAERLQLGVETVYRWLRSGKIRGNRISHKAWRISERELAGFINRQNVSELLFEEYLAEYQLENLIIILLSPERELVDYRLVHNGQVLWFEVKEFNEDPNIISGSTNVAHGGAFDPHVALRRKIGKAVEKFRDYDGECCSLILFNERANLVDIHTPRIILGAMLGAVAFRVPVNLQTRKETGPVTSVFTDGGMLIHPHIRKPQNTTISAVIGLAKFPVGQKEFRIKTEKIEIEEQRCLSWEEHSNLMEADRAAYDRLVLKAIVFENPHARKPLPRDIFVGPFDERWGLSGDYIAPVHTGSELAKLRQMEHELDLDLGPLQKHVIREKRRSPKDCD